MGYLDIDTDYLLKILKKSISIRSVLPDEEAYAAFIAEEIRAMGIDPEWHEVAPGRPNVYATADLGPSGRFLVFSGHSDTVGAAEGWATDPFEPVIDKGRLYGLGAINMKAGLACSLVAFKALVEATELHGKLGRLGFVMTVDQEGLSLGAKAVLKTEYGGCDAMLHGEHFFGDSEGNYLPMAATGKILYKLTVRGRAAHAFRPQEGGVNAIVDASRIIVALDRLRMREHPLFGRGTVCSLKIEGGYKTYSIIVPDLCEIIITRLTVPGETVETAVTDMNDLIKSLDLESSVQVETPPPSYQPYFLDLDSPFCRIFKETYCDILGKSPSFRPHVGIVDANIYVAEGGIPTVVFGPKGANHHQAGEYVEISSLEPVSQVYVETAIRYLQTNCDRKE